MIFHLCGASFELRRRRRSIDVIGEQQSPWFAVIDRDTNVPLVENDAITFVGCLDTAILEAVEDDQDDGFRRRFPEM